MPSKGFKQHEIPKPHLIGLRRYLRGVEEKIDSDFTAEISIKTQTKKFIAHIRLRLSQGKYQSFSYNYCGNNVIVDIFPFRVTTEGTKQQKGVVFK